MNWGGIMTNKEHFVATLQACYFGDRNAFNEIVSIYDDLVNINDKLSSALNSDENKLVKGIKFVKNEYNSYPSAEEWRKALLKELGCD